MHRSKGGFRNMKGEWIAEPPYPWRRVDGRTNEMEIAAWHRYQTLLERHERCMSGNPTPFLTARELKWSLLLLAVLTLLLLFGR